MKKHLALVVLVYIGICFNACHKPILEFPKGQCKSGDLTGWYHHTFMGVAAKCSGSICKYKEKVRDVLSWRPRERPLYFTNAIFIRGPHTQSSHPIYALKMDRLPAKIFGKKIDRVSGTLAWEIYDHDPEYKGPPRYITIEFKDADVIEVERVEYYPQCECSFCPPEFLERDKREQRENNRW